METPASKITSPVLASEATRRTKEVNAILALLPEQMENVWRRINEAINEGDYSIDIRITVMTMPPPSTVSEDEKRKSAILARLVMAKLKDHQYDVKAQEHAVTDETWLTVNWDIV